eukprot:g21293.t1
MRRQDALLLTVGRRVQQFFLQMLRWKQRRILRRWFPSEHEEYAVKEQAAKLQQSEECLGTSLALAFLAEHGRLIELCIHDDADRRPSFLEATDMLRDLTATTRLDSAVSQDHRDIL